jgi:MoxR-like ATPase
MTRSRRKPYGEFKGNRAPFYQTTPDVADIVNCAIYLGRPLLVEGEAGCGKTTLARAIAHELGLPEPVAMVVKSTSQAKDLLYRFNALQRLQDIQDPKKKEARYVYPYVTLQPLGRAIRDGRPQVILIDEIDKADIDFPNDLLEVLQAFRFSIDDLPLEEDGRCRKANGYGRIVEGKGGTRPIVVITSNREKQLPEPFLRRCLYIELKFPEDPSVLAAIVRKNINIDDAFAKPLATAVEHFLQLRAEAVRTGMQKPPATSELIDWINVLQWRRQDLGQLATGGSTPFWQLLFKTLQDVDAFTARIKGAPR